MDVRIVRVAERRHEDPGPAAAHLVHVVGDLRLEVAVDVDGEPRLLLREHEPVAVVVVTGVALIQVGVDPAVAGALGVVPVVDDQQLAVRVLRRHQQHYRVLKDFPNLGRFVSGQAVRNVDDRLPVAHFGGVNRGVEEIEGNTLAGEGARLFGRQAARVGELVVDRDEPVEPIEILPGADGDQDVRVPLGSRTARGVCDPLGSGGEVLQVLQHPRIPRQLTVGSDFEAEELRGRRDAVLGSRRLRGRGSRGGKRQPRRSS